jgi:hypothetical protein
MNLGFGRHTRRALYLFALSSVLIGFGYAYRGTPWLATGLDYEVFAGDLPAVSALAFDRNGDLYATLEKRHGQGRLVHIRNGRARDVLGGLDKPDGILLRGDTLYITNEEGPHGLVAYGAGVRRDLDGSIGAEGIATADAGGILVIEDRKDVGRLLRVDPATSGIQVLVDGLNQAEGVCQTPAGEIYYVEKTSDRLSRHVGGQTTTVATGLVKPAFLNCLADGSILITEDRTNFGRLLRYRDGSLEVLARFLGSPQSVVVGTDGAYYLAEQRRNRVLKIHGS